MFCLMVYKPWTESETNILLNHLHLTIKGMLKSNILPGRSYWAIYDQLAVLGYQFDFKRRVWVKIGSLFDGFCDVEVGKSGAL